MKYLSKVSDGITYLTDLPSRALVPVKKQIHKGYVKLPIVRTIERHKEERDNYKEAADKLLELALDQKKEQELNAVVGTIPDGNYRNRGYGGSLSEPGCLDDFGFYDNDGTWISYDASDSWDPWENPAKLMTYKEVILSPAKRRRPWQVSQFAGPKLVQELNKETVNEEPEVAQEEEVAKIKQGFISRLMFGRR